MRKHSIGKVLVLHPETHDLEWVPISDLAQPSDRKVSLDLIEQGGTTVTVSFESQDGQHFVGTYRKKNQEVDGIIRVEKSRTEDGAILLNGTWEKGNGEEWQWFGLIELDEDPSKHMD